MTLFRFFFSFLSLFLIAWYGCLKGTGHSNNSGKPVAKVYDKVLYSANLAGIIKPGTSQDDSAEIAREYINEWVKNNLMVHYVESSLYNDEMLAETDRLANEYRYSLLLYAYRRSIYERFLDTIITGREIREYLQHRMNESGTTDTSANIQNENFLKELILNERKKQILEKAIGNLHDEALVDNAIEIFN